ncbi:MAG TPA: RNA polymerase sigma factor [Rhizomicrobium sp.]
MVEKSGTDRERAGVPNAAETAASAADLWFDSEVLPLEALLMQFLEHNWRNPSDIPDLRQDVYVRVYEAALRSVPENPKQFVLATARNLLIDRVRHEQVVPIESAADLDSLGVAFDAPGADRTVSARDELRHLQAALDRLPPRCREVVILGRIEGLSRTEIAARLRVTEHTVSRYLSQGICMLADILHGEPANIRRQV